MKVSFPFNSVNHDRRYKSEEWAAYFASFIGTGVFPNPSTNLQVTANGNMTINVLEGKAWIGGRFFSEENNMITLDNADGVLNRIDRVVVRCDYVTRLIYLSVKKGTYSQTPTPPALQRDADAYELALADVRVNKGTINIQQANITDTRLDSSVCGIVTQTVKTIDTTTLYAQIQADMAGFKASEQAGFISWFNGIKDILDENTAGNLLNLINQNTTAITAISKKTVENLTHTKVGTVHKLTGLKGVTGKISCVASMTAPYVVGNSFTVDGVTYTIATSNGEPLDDNAFIAGVDISLIIDTVGKKLNFKLGGGGGFPKSWKDERTAECIENILKDDPIVMNQYTDIATSNINLMPQVSTGEYFGIYHLSYNGKYFCARKSTNNVAMIYEKLGDTFTFKQSLSVNIGAVQKIEFSRNGDLAIQNSENIFIYRLNSSHIFELYKTIERWATPLASMYGTYSLDGTLMCVYLQYPSYPSSTAVAKVFYTDTYENLKGEITAGQMPKVIQNTYFLPNNILMFSFSQIIIDTQYYMATQFLISPNQPITKIYEESRIDTILSYSISIPPVGNYIYTDGKNRITYNGQYYVFKNYVRITGLKGDRGLSFSPDGKYAVEGITAAPYIILYKIVGDSFVKLPNPAILPPLYGSSYTSVQWSATNEYITIDTSSTAPFMMVYSTNSKTVVRNMTSLVISNELAKQKFAFFGIGISKQNALIGEQCKVNLFPPINNNLGGL